jgi:hypothetical protein
MKFEAFFVFLIILLGLILCSFLGTCYNSYYSKEGFQINNNETLTLTDDDTTNENLPSTYDNYDHYKKTYSQVTNEITFTGPNGDTASIITNSNGTQTIQIVKANSDTPVVFVPNNKPNKFISEDGAIATLTTDSNGQKAIKIKTTDGEIILFKQSGSHINDITITSTQYYGSTGSPIQESNYSLAYQPNNYNSSSDVSGNLSQGIQNTQELNGSNYTVTGLQPNTNANMNSIIGPYGNAAYYAQGPQGNTYAGVVQQPTTYTSTPTTSVDAITGPYGNTAYYAQGPQGNTYAGTTSNSNVSTTPYDYSSSLPQGIPSSLIPPGQENLYILKSEVVPPVCPVCPSSSVCPKQEKCPPCPACARCPEPSFECKKVPNYNAINNDYLPVPVLNDFSGFGM